MPQKPSTIQQQSLSSDLEFALTGLIKLSKALKIYPTGHPSLAAASAEAGAAFAPLLAQPEPQPCHITKTGFSLDREPLAPQNTQLQKLALQLVERKVRHLLFLPGLTNEELLIFAEELSRPAADLLAAGGLPHQLCQRQVKTIWINETNLAEILAKREQPQEERLANESAAEQTIELQTAVSEALFPPAQESSLIDTMRDLLELLKEPLADSEHEQLTRQTCQLAPDFFSQTGLPGSLAVFCLLLNHQGDQKRSQAQRKSAAQAIEQLLTDNIKQLLAGAVADQSLKDSQRRALTRTLTGLGEKLAPQLLDNLYAERDALIRRKYTAILANMGETLFGLLEDSLQSTTWHRVRNVVTVLGETRLETALPLLETAKTHPEPRVRRSVIQALHRIGGSQAIPLLVEFCQDPSTELQQPAIIALGSLGNPKAIVPLAAMLTEFDPFGKKIDLKKEIIHALVNLNSSQGIIPLLKIARRRNLLRRTHLEELRAEAITALGQLGNSHLLPILKRLPKSNKGPVNRALKQATAQLEKQAHGA